MMRLWVLGAGLAVAACGGMSDEREAALVENAVANAEAAAENATALGAAAEKAADAPDRDAWIGEWVGVEGLVLTIEKGTAPGRYRLTNKWSLDDDATGTFDGVATAAGIAFNRPDGAQTLVASDGDATGLKYLAGKKDCLKVADGEGYCRD